MNFISNNSLQRHERRASNLSSGRHHFTWNDRSKSRLNQKFKAYLAGRVMAQ